MSAFHCPACEVGISAEATPACWLCGALMVMGEATALLRRKVSDEQVRAEWEELSERMEAI